ncbi:potassium channel family protein [Sulfurospirillum arcachonense]|uniref:potassium channel family protein n=1 Tax=Sulfurospirillum arcachonense TaxID=57666 RepID=UPI00046A2A02|nr:potassium channel protein [Sulfurospirillum arcachonense]
MTLTQKLKKLLNWSSRSAPHIDLNTELYQQLKPFRLPLILVVFMIMVGTLGYVLIDGFTLLDAVYQSGITFTTVGFGEISPISPAGRLFTITLIILGFGAFSFSIGILVEVLNKGQLVKIIKERSMLYKIARLKNHFVICHHSEITIELSKQFRENHIPFVVIDPRDDLAELAIEHKYPYFVQEDPHTEAALLKSYLSSAKGLITLSENTADNIAQIASTRLYENEIGLQRPYYIITSASNESDMVKLKKLGADRVISATKLMAERLRAMSLRPDMENMLEKLLYRQDAPIDMEEIKVPDHSWMRFKKLKEAHLRDITNVSIVGIRDAKDTFIPMPKGDVLIGTGCKLLVIGTGESIRATKRIIRKKQKPEELKYV